jgi:regulator of sirC expression with transglutaminase-like and TPR domain
MEVLQQREAVLRLLGDDDPVTVALVKQQLTQCGEELDGLRELLASADSARAAEQLREIILTIESQKAEERFSALCANFGEDGDIEHAAWELAATFHPGEDFTPQRQMLDAWGREALTRLSSTVPRRIARVATLAQFLGRDLRLRGNENEYYLYSNSLIPRVIDTRQGIPISLVLIYMMVGRRAGIAIEGVGLPGHFLARHGEIVFDPFHGGRRVSMEECDALLAQQNLTLMPHHLAPTTARQMLIRMLTNLRYIATGSDPVLAEKIHGWEAKLRTE